MTAIPSPRRPGRGIASAVTALVATTVLLAGCSGQRDPGSYTDSVKQDFVSSCWTTTVADLPTNDLKLVPSDSRSEREAKAAKVVPASEVKAAKTFCGCAYAKLKKKVKFGRFKSVNTDLRENGGKLPSDFTKAYASCDEKAPSAKGTT